MVVMNGLAMTAGSSPNRFASRGSEQPTSFAARTVIIRDVQMTAATITPTRFKNISLRKLRTASVTPQSSDTRASFHITRKISENFIS